MTGNQLGGQILSTLTEEEREQEAKMVVYMGNDGWSILTAEMARAEDPIHEGPFWLHPAAVEQQRKTRPGVAQGEPYLC